eukprot:CAMPEP_0119316686 /NCGR_PEP_ID=MMETSP1333-20130426/40463_1 /TAXON_ID=418940 /ORGANISM="Scyphosphaera apsteinii, Strain RCC1455" /LENGTH=92 /DNA_ID=CAMNT_0007322391 /DNA_START=382 /DNA_END=660 /DNA_ORIENTATION=+
MGELNGKAWTASTQEMLNGAVELRACVQSIASEDVHERKCGPGILEDGKYERGKMHVQIRTWQNARRGVTCLGSTPKRSARAELIRRVAITK